jgi:hypothetical protein
VSQRTLREAPSSIGAPRAPKIEKNPLNGIVGHHKQRSSWGQHMPPTCPRVPPMVTWLGALGAGWGRPGAPTKNAS